MKDKDIGYASIGELINIKGGGTPNRKNPEFWNGEIKWATVKDLKDNYLEETQDYISQDGLENSAANLIPPNKVILATRVGLGKVAINKCELSINQDLKALSPKDSLDIKYLFYFLKSKAPDIISMGKGATVKGITLNNLKSLQIPLPPLAEQERIAAILDKADALRAHTCTQLAAYDELLQAVFLEMFGDPVLNEKGWEVEELGNLFQISSGGTPSRKESDYWENGEIPWVKTGEVRGTEIRSTSEKITEKGLKNSSCKIYPPNSILIAMYGQGKTRGQVGRLNISATTNQACAAIEPQENISSIFLFEYLKLSYIELRNLGRGGNQPNLNLNLIKSFPIIVPPLRIQYDFDIKVRNISTQKVLLNQQIQKLEALFNSLLQRAFRGEL